MRGKKKMNNKIYFEKEGFETILNSLKTEYEDICKIYERVETKSKNINGENNWIGKGQKSFYNSYLSIASNILTIKSSIENCNNFLQNTMDAYCKEDEIINKSIENNKEKLSIN